MHFLVDSIALAVLYRPLSSDLAMIRLVILDSVLRPLAEWMLHDDVQMKDDLSVQRE